MYAKQAALVLDWGATRVLAVMTDSSSKFSRKLLCLAVAGACAGSAVAAPTGPVVNAGSASYDPATLTVTSTTARTQISWQSFHVAAGEVVNFVQPNARSSVLNQVFNPQTLNILGGLSSNGSVLFMSNGRVTGAGVNLDLAGLISTSLRLPRMALAYKGVEALAQPRPLATLAAGSIYVISQDEQAVSAANGDVVLNPGKSVELVGAAMPNLRVELTAPVAEAINLSRLLESKRELGIFAGLIQAPTAARRAVQRETEAVATASAKSRDLERFYRYAMVYARLRGAARQEQGGLLQAAAAPTGRAMFAAIKARTSLLPREIEIGAARPQELALRPASSLPAAIPEPPAATQEMHAVASTAESEVQTDGAHLLALASVEPPAEMVATRNSSPVAVAAAGAAQAEGAPVLAFASVEPPAEMVATRNAPQLTLADASAVQTDSALVRAYPPVEPPAAMVATRTPLPAAIAAAGAAPAQNAPLLALAAAEPPARLVQQDTEPAARHPALRSAPVVVVVALAQQHTASAPQESTVKELRIERRAPRYFTDYRGALFFM